MSGELDAALLFATKYRPSSAFLIPFCLTVQHPDLNFTILVYPHHHPKHNQLFYLEQNVLNYSTNIFIILFYLLSAGTEHGESVIQRLTSG